MAQNLSEMGHHLEKWQFSLSFLGIFSLLYIVLTDSFPGLFPFILGPWRQLFKIKFSLASIFFQNGHHAIFDLWGVLSHNMHFLC